MFRLAFRKRPTVRYWQLFTYYVYPNPWIEQVNIYILCSKFVQIPPTYYNKLSSPILKIDNGEGCTYTHRNFCADSTHLL